VVIARKKDDHEAFLVAWVIPENETIDTAEIITALREELPAYMIPHTIIPLEQFPLTPNKKVDRKALSQRELIVSIHDSEETSLTQREVQLATYFQEVLQLEQQPGKTANFFALGGDSLIAVKLIGVLMERLQLQVSLKTIFDHPTVTSLAAFLDRHETAITATIPTVATREQYPVTMPQYHLWLASQQPKVSMAYNMSAVYRVMGTIDKIVVTKAIQTLIKKYEILRTVFVEIAGIPHQKVKPFTDITFQVDEFQGAVQEVYETYAHSLFNLEKDLLLRVAIVEDGAQTGLIFVTHHVIMDGWSLERFIDEVIVCYKTQLETTDAKETSLLFQFKDYAVWQQQFAKQQEEKNEAFWTKYLNEYTWKPLIPTNQSSNITNAQKEAGEYRFTWDDDFYKQLKTAATDYQQTLHTLLVSAFAVTLHKIYSHQDVCLGTINAGRTHAGTNKALGLFAKTLPLRVTIDEEEAISELLQQTRNDLLSLDAHQDIPEALYNTFRLDILFVLQTPTFNYQHIEVTEDLALELVPTASKYNRLPILLNCIEQADRIEGILNFDQDLYDTSEMELFFLKYEYILQQIIQNQHLSIATTTTELPLENENTIEINFNF
jgi:acyl carrier protein